MNKELEGLIRHALTTLGGGLATHGWLAASSVEPVVGSIMVLAGVVWSVYNKMQHKAELENKDAN